MKLTKLKKCKYSCLIVSMVALSFGSARLTAATCGDNFDLCGLWPDLNCYNATPTQPYLTDPKSSDSCPKPTYLQLGNKCGVKFISASKIPFPCGPKITDLNAC
jgi:hypothetical protein